MKRRRFIPLLIAPLAAKADDEPRLIPSSELARKWRRTKSLTAPVIEVRRTSRPKKGITLEEEIVEVKVDADTETRFQNIQFALNSDRLETGVTQAQIVEIAAAMKLAGTELFLIEGHTCDLGVPAYNKDLSQRRAETVVSALVQLGVPQNRLDAIGFGAEKPLSPGTDEAARASNRRVQIYRKV